MVGPQGFYRFCQYGVLAVILIFQTQINECRSLNLEGLALLEFRSRVEDDPYSALENWNPNHENPCMWYGVHCKEGKVHLLVLKQLYIKGILVPEIGRLGNLRALILHKNRFFGSIPKDIGMLTMLEVLDLRENDLSGKIPVEISHMLLLRRLLLRGNKFDGDIPPEHGKFQMVYGDISYDQVISPNAEFGISGLNRRIKQGNRFRSGGLYHDEEKDKEFLAENAFVLGALHDHAEIFKYKRRILLQDSKNLPALLSNSPPSIQTVEISSLGSGSFPAIPNSTYENDTDEQLGVALPPVASIPSPDSSISKIPDSLKNEEPEKGKWKIAVIIAVVAFLLSIVSVALLACRRQGAETIRPWKTGLSGQLQKAFVTGVPKLNRTELETACEDFSNIIGTNPNCTLFKGTLSNGVEIAVVSSSVASAKDWSRRSEIHFRKKIDSLSRVNHKNFCNLLGYCEEEDPFMRIMVFEYAPNGSLNEHLHNRGVDHLDWPTRMRIIMGTAYFLQYIHHELNPPMVHSNLHSGSVLLTNDYATKVAEIDFWKELTDKAKIPDVAESEHSHIRAAASETNVYCFGILLLEIISGKPSQSEEQGSLVNWASKYLSDKRNISYMIDPELKAFKNEELDVICEVIQECINQDPRQRPTMKEVTPKLRDALGISPEAAAPRLSPLWWAELEILSMEAS